MHSATWSKMGSIVISHAPSDRAGLPGSRGSTRPRVSCKRNHHHKSQRHPDAKGGELPFVQALRPHYEQTSTPPRECAPAPSSKPHRTFLPPLEDKLPGRRECEATPPPAPTSLRDCHNRWRAPM